MLDILATGDYYAAIDDHRADPDLRDELARACSQRLRRIDRFTQLCLIGSHRCAGDLPLPPQTGLYLGSRFASISNTISVHTQMIEHGQVPKPANFINTLSNSAGFYVGKNLQLEGKNLFVSRIDASTEAVFQIARLDLDNRQVETVLLGIVDEAPHPLADHRRRLGVAADTPLAEASHWFLVRRAGAAESSPGEALARVTEMQTLADSDELSTWLGSQAADGDTVRWLHYSAAGNHNYRDHEEPQLAGLLAAFPHYSPSVRGTGTVNETDRPESMRYSPARTAGVMSAFVQDSGVGPVLLTVHRDSDRRYHVMRIEKPPA